MNRPLHQIASDIRADIAAGNWKAPSRAHAMPYLEAMTTLDTIDDRYGCDSGKMIVLYFLSNAATYKGETAYNLKQELRALVGAKAPPTHSGDWR